MYFNELFRVSAIQMRALGVFNPEIGVDSKMFVDPKLLENAEDEFVGSRSDLMNYFAGTVSTIQMVRQKTDSDIGWVAAWNRMMFKETSNTGIGHSKDGTNGRGIGKVLAKQIVARAIEILPLVDFQPDLFELVGIFSKGIGCDRLSDMIVSILKPRFLAYTDRVTRTLAIQQYVVLKLSGRDFLLPRFKVGDDPIVLLPQNLLKPLPIALNIEDALVNADLNEAARAEVNKLFSNAYRRGIHLSKTQIRDFIWSNKGFYKGILSNYQNVKGVPYDFDSDPARVSGFEPIARELIGSPTINLEGIDEWGRIFGCVEDTIKHLKHNIEQNKLSDVLYDDAGVPRKEVISQRLIYSMATIFGRLYNVDVSQQGNAGPGAVDFRFTVGHKNRLLVELKLSTHERLKDGYYEQLPSYGIAEGIKKLILVVIRVTENDSHITNLERSIAQKAMPIQLIIIDAVPKPSASKRKASAN